MNSSARRFLAPVLILALAFVLRANQLDLVLHNHDYGIPHGLGIGILEAVQDGRWSELPVLSFPTGIGLRNPAGISYVWALAAFFERSPYTATLISVLLSVIAVAAVYALASQMAGTRAGEIAAFLMAVSPWSITFARGAWMQGQLEAFASIAAWLVWLALRHRRARRLFGGLALAGLFGFSYLTAFGLGAQAVLAGVWALSRARRARSGRRRWPAPASAPWRFWSSRRRSSPARTRVWQALGGMRIAA